MTKRYTGYDMGDRIEIHEDYNWERASGKAGEAAGGCFVLLLIGIFGFLVPNVSSA